MNGAPADRRMRRTPSGRCASSSGACRWPSKWVQTSLESTELAGRMNDLPRGVVPKGTRCLTAAIDLGKYLTHWIVVAWGPEAACHVVDYGRIEVASEDLGVEQATLVALREFRVLILEGWPVRVAGGGSR